MKTIIVPFLVALLWLTSLAGLAQQKPVLRLNKTPITTNGISFVRIKNQQVVLDVADSTSLAPYSTLVIHLARGAQQVDQMEITIQNPAKFKADITKLTKLAKAEDRLLIELLGQEKGETYSCPFRK